MGRNITSIKEISRKFLRSCAKGQLLKMPVCACVRIHVNLKESGLQKKKYLSKSQFYQNPSADGMKFDSHSLRWVECVNSDLALWFMYFSIWIYCMSHKIPKNSQMEKAEE